MTINQIMELIPKILDTLVLIGVASGVSIPLIQNLLASVKSKKIQQVADWALEAVKWADVNFSHLEGADRRAKAIEELGGIINNTSQKYNMSTTDIERKIDAAYKDYKGSNLD